MFGDGRRLPSPETREGSDGDWTRDFLRNSETPEANTSPIPFPASINKRNKITSLPKTATYSNIKNHLFLKYLKIIFYTIPLLSLLLLRLLKLPPDAPAARRFRIS